MQCSHYYDKKASPFLRWDERNAHAMTNKVHFKHHHGKAPDYSLWMFETYGLKFMKKLQKDSDKKKIYTMDDYLDLVALYLDKIAKLKGGSV